MIRARDKWCNNRAILQQSASLHQLRPLPSPRFWNGSRPTAIVLSCICLNSSPFYIRRGCVLCTPNHGMCDVHEDIFKLMETNWLVANYPVIQCPSHCRFRWTDTKKVSLNSQISVYLNDTVDVVVRWCESTFFTTLNRLNHSRLQGCSTLQPKVFCVIYEGRSYSQGDVLPVTDAPSVWVRRSPGFLPAFIETRASGSRRPGYVTSRHPRVHSVRGCGHGYHGVQGAK